MPVVSRAWLEVPDAAAVSRELRRDGGKRAAEPAAHAVHHLRWHGAGVGDMTRAAPVLSQVRVFDGSPVEIRAVREFVGRIVGGCPVADDLVLLSSELATNAVLHSASGADGVFAVTVLIGSQLVRVEVHDLGSDKAPVVRGSREPGESGAGLGLVEMIADRWGFDGDCRGRVVWFEMDVS